ncbi:hypothetical protein [Clostridium sp. BNL1100]|nr:hypothetical protein [Clostridium sp. BNL1100]
MFCLEKEFHPAVTALARAMHLNDTRILGISRVGFSNILASAG